MKENWGPHFMPPRYYEVLDRRVFPSSTDPNKRTEWVWLSGTHLSLGIPIRGLSGDETFVERTVTTSEYGDQTRYQLTFYNLPPGHPLYEMMKPGNHR